MEDLIQSTRPARFGAFEVDLRAGELRKQGLRIKLQEQPLQVLAMLLQHPGEVVTREELQKKLWPADTFVDFDHGLNKAITKIREALGDSADCPRFIETIPRRGYRFIAPVDRSGGPAAATNEPPVTTSRGLARALFILIQAGYLVMYGEAFYHLPAIRGLAELLPFRNAAVYVVLCALSGAALRLYLLSAVAFDYPNSGRLFKRLFPGILLIDLAWSASPILLFYRLGEFILLFVAGLAFLPFSQRSLLRAAYAPGGGRISAKQLAGSR
jgi:DNA-binding winged helix-turn-helix (wHTH) protein